MLGRCHVGAGDLDIFGHILAACHTNVEPHKLPLSAHPKVPC